MCKILYLPNMMMFLQVPQKLCGPAGCGFVPGPEQCYEKVQLPFSIAEQQQILSDFRNTFVIITPKLLALKSLGNFAFLLPSSQK